MQEWCVISGQAETFLHHFFLKVLIFSKNNNNNNNSRSTAIKSQELPTGCRPHVHNRDMVRMSSFAVIVGFLDWNYQYKLVATQISHAAKLAPIPYTGWKIHSHQNWTSATSYNTNWKEYTLNHLTIERHTFHLYG